MQLIQYWLSKYVLIYIFTANQKQFPWNKKELYQID